MKKIFKNILIFIVLCLSFLTFELIFYFMGIDFNTMTFKTSVILTFIKEMFFFLLLLLIYHKYLKEKWLDFRKHFKEYFKLSFKYWMLGLFVMYISNLIIIIFTNDLGENETAVQSIITAYPLIAFTMTTFLAPVVEELIFRKALKDCVSNQKFFPIISGLIFGYIHVMSSSNPLEYLLIIPYGSLGYAFGYILNKTDNIYCSIMMHMIHNGILTILSIVLEVVL